MSKIKVKQYILAGEMLDDPSIKWSGKLTPKNHLLDLFDNFKIETCKICGCEINELGYCNDCGNINKEKDE